MGGTLLFIGLSFATAVVNRLMQKRGIPVAPVNMLLGMVFGPLFFDLLVADDTALSLMELAVILLLFSAGLGIHWRSFRQAIWPGIGVGLCGIVLSAVLGGIAVFLLNARPDEALYAGVALAATSVGIGVQVLEQYDLLNKRVGRILLAAAVVDDISALYLLSSLHAGLDQKLDAKQLLLSMSISFLALFILALVLLWLAKKAHQYLMSYGHLSYFSYHLLFLVTGSGITFLLGLSSVVGAFIAGVCLAIGCHNSKEHLRVAKYFHRLAEWLSPMFFIGIGIQLVTIDIGSSHLLLLITAIFLAAVVGKLFTPWFFQIGISGRDRWILGISLLPRGEVGLIVASAGYQMGHLGEHTMVALIVMTILTTFLPPLGIAWLVKHRGSNASD